MNRYPLTLLLSLTLALSSGCSQDSQDTATSAPKTLTRDAVCMLDGMILLDHPGPKGQAIFKNGEVHFFCDTKGLFSTLHDPNYKMKIKQAFVQDFGKREWGSYSDRWIDVKQAFFVIDSRQLGAMGPTLATFGNRADADHFAEAFGGSVLTFDELDEETFEAYQQRIRQQLRGATNHTNHDHDDHPDPAPISDNGAAHPHHQH